MQTRTLLALHLLLLTRVQGSQHEQHSLQEAPYSLLLLLLLALPAAPCMCVVR
jgi:hypothetical protein